ncbi:MAG: diguanylate cyclase (GGDEF)-like protein [Flavobacteriales bacterium]|jgi:diguanylate cyclase (GGDEF)-like protein
MTQLNCPNGETNCPISSELQSIREEIHQLKDQVRTDDLTSLFNHRHFALSLEQEIERTRRSQHPTTLILLDIDHFKAVNDTYGHVVGDSVLQEVAKVFVGAVRKIDIPCRYGGEEFGIILPSTPTIVGTQVAERIREQIEALVIELDDGRELKITISIGVDSYHYFHPETVEQFVARCDEFLYKAKDGGRNIVCHAIHKISDGALVSSDEKDALFDAFGDE